MLTLGRGTWGQDWDGTARKYKVLSLLLWSWGWMVVCASPRDCIFPRLYREQLSRDGLDVTRDAECRVLSGQFCIPRAYIMWFSH